MRTLAALVAVAAAWSAGAAGAQSRAERLGSPSGGAAPRPREAAPAPTRDPEVDAPAPRRAVDRGTPPDVVLTRDGGMLRGTIVRSEPGRAVEIQLSTGELHRVRWGEVRWVGPAEEAPRSERAQRRPEVIVGAPWRPGVEVRFEANDRITLHRVETTAQATARAEDTLIRVHASAQFYQRECTAPCTVRLEPGVYRFGLAVGTGDTVPVPAVDITGPGTLRGLHIDNSGFRGVGGVLLTLGIVAAAMLIPMSFLEGDWDAEVPMGAVGGIGGGALALVSIPLLALQSGVVLRFEP